MMTKEKILDSAYNLFSIHGYEGTSLSQIAKEVGIKKPSIYAHFSSKEEIFITILENNIRSFSLYLDRIVNEVKGKNSKVKLYNFLKQVLEYTDYSQASKGFWSAIMFFPPSFLLKTIREHLKELNTKIKGIIREIFVEGIEKGEIKESDVDKLVYSFVCLIQGNFAIMLYDNMKDKKSFAYERLEKSWELFWSSIEKK